MTTTNPFKHALQPAQFNYYLHLIDSENIALRHAFKTQESIHRFVRQYRFNTDDQSRLDALETYLSTYWGRLLVTLPQMDNLRSEKSDPCRDYLISILTQALDCYDTKLTDMQRSALTHAQVHLFLKKSHSY